MNSKYRFIPDRETGFLTEEDTKAYFSRVGWAVFVLGIASSLASFGLSALITGSLPQILENSIASAIASHILSLIAIYAVGTPLFYLVLKPLPKIKPFREKMKFGSFMGGFSIAILLMLVGNYISNIILTVIQTGLNTSTQNPVEQAISPNDPAMIAVTTVFMVIVFPILEELLFRKILCDRLLPLGEGYAIFVSAAIFGLYHGNFYQFAYAFLLGALFSLIYVKTGKLIYSTVYHMLINFLGAVVAPWIVAQIDLERLYTVLESGTVDPADPIWISMFLLMIYEAIIMVPAVFGIVLIVKAKNRKTVTLDTGILPPPKKHRIANIFCTVGVAAAVTYFVFTFVVSIIPR